VGGLSKRLIRIPSHPQPEKLKTTSKNIVNMKIPAPRFKAFRLKDTENNTRNINPFFVQKTLDRIARKVKKLVTPNECKTSDRSI
jgi:hypothetical protein